MTDNALTVAECMLAIIEAPANGLDMQIAQEYAKTYLRGEDNHTQILYVRSNLQYWHGETARIVKTRLDRAIEQKEGF